MAKERRYLKGDRIEVVEFPNKEIVGESYDVKFQDGLNGMVLCNAWPFPQKFYAHQVKLIKRPKRNWVRVLFTPKVARYFKSPVKE